jgi:hypothetical protein
MMLALTAHGMAGQAAPSIVQRIGLAASNPSKNQTELPPLRMESFKPSE